ncbi:MAG: IclR family transcriptional regulator [Nocardiopsaceae bacterium]|nr:IclR family transcriptional regulator [Nocardiopsaceae bacterium]
MQKAHEPRRAERPAYPIASVDKALRLLMLFREQTRVRLSDASEHLGVAHSTAHRLLAMLAYYGFIRQEQDSRAYVAGPALVEIGLAAIRQMDIRLHARPVLEDLAASFAETAHLAVLEGAKVRYLDAVESSRALRVASRTGAALPANCTASGKAMLAALPESEVTAMFTAQELPALTKQSVTSLASLLAELRETRERGYALNIEESEDGVASVAVPVSGRKDAPVAALVVSAPVTRLDAASAERIATRLRDDAERLSDLIGPHAGH